MAAVKEIYGFLDQLAPFATQMDFDNAGFLVGRGAVQVERLLVALDITEEVVREAAELGSYTITLTDTMDAEAELEGIRTMLEAMGRAFALYPEGFLAQFRNEAFNQKYTQVDSTAGADTSSKLINFKEIFGGLAHKRSMRIGTMFGTSIFIPGASQIYNEQYWKLPIYYGGRSACDRHGS